MSKAVNGEWGGDGVKLQVGKVGHVGWNRAHICISRVQYNVIIKIGSKF